MPDGAFEGSNSLANQPANITASLESPCNYHVDTLGRKVSRRLSWLVCSVAMLWIVWIAATRWNGQPARADTLGSIEVDQPTSERMQAFCDALKSIPAMPQITLPSPPEGMKWKRGWKVSAYAPDCRNGEWDMSSRPNLQSVVAYLNRDDVRLAMRSIADTAPDDAQPSRSASQLMPVISQFRNATQLFVTRARWHHAELGDHASALKDLLTVLHLSRVIRSDVDARVRRLVQGIARTANTELRLMAWEHQLDTPFARAAILAIQQESKSLDAEWAEVVDAEIRSTRTRLNGLYAESRPGWLVLNRLDNVVLGTRSPKQRSGIWNLGSVLFNGRDAQEAKVGHLGQQLRSVKGLPFAQAVAILGFASGDFSFNLVDGPAVGQFTFRRFDRDYWQMVRSVSHRRATLASLAISAYRTEHRASPDALEDLVPKYLSEIPLDAFSQQPLRYRRLPDGEILLYSVGPDLIDDGGTKIQYQRPRNQRSLGPLHSEFLGDHLFSSTRRNANFEPPLVEAAP